MIPSIALDPRDPRPLYVQIADAIVAAVASGDLAPGERLPPMRALARDLRCALITVSQAYDILAARGRVTSRVGRGTFVAAALADARAPAAFARAWEPELERFAQADRLEGVLDQLASAGVPGSISLATGHPAPETFPLAEFGRAMARTLADDPPEAMQYRAQTGDPDLCAALAAGLRARGCSAAGADIVVSSGAQQAADLIARVLLTAGAVVAAEAPTYPGTLGVFDARGATYVEVQSDAEGVRVDDVERVFAEFRPRLFYIAPIAQNPTGAVLPARRGKAIVALARRYDVVVLEDQTGWNFTYDAPAPPPLAAHDTDGRVVLMESLSKSIFPALRIGYVCVKGGLRASIDAAKVRTDSFTSTLTQRALWRFLESPAYTRHLRAARALYRSRRDAFVDRLTQALPWAAVRPPEAGTSVWLPLPSRISTQAAFDACAREGVLVMPAEPFYPTRAGPPALRLSFGDLDERAIATGVERLARALERLRASSIAAAS
ncbi:MAG: PLP-dependent aminotransferase family protein [Candidatus Velthaea sp.]